MNRSRPVVLGSSFVLLSALGCAAPRPTAGITTKGVATREAPRVSRGPTTTAPDDVLLPLPAGPPGAARRSTLDARRQGTCILHG